MKKLLIIIGVAVGLNTSIVAGPIHEAVRVNNLDEVERLLKSGVDINETDGGNETANSRLIIKTAGPDISLATDGKLGAAELQKSNDLRSWRRLGDVPAEASEVLVTPRESGNEFYRLKKK
jgi:hypothetical protein